MITPWPSDLESGPGGTDDADVDEVMAEVAEERTEPRRQMDEEEAGRRFQWTHRPKRAKTPRWRIVLGAGLAGLAILALSYGSIWLYAKWVGW